MYRGVKQKTVVSTGARCPAQFVFIADRFIVGAAVNNIDARNIMQHS